MIKSNSSPQARKAATFKVNDEYLNYSSEYYTYYSIIRDDNENFTVTVNIEEKGPNKNAYGTAINKKIPSEWFSLKWDDFILRYSTEIDKFYVKISTLSKDSSFREFLGF